MDIGTTRAFLPASRRYKLSTLCPHKISMDIGTIRAFLSAPRWNNLTTLRPNELMNFFSSATKVQRCQIITRFCFLIETKFSRCFPRLPRQAVGPQERSAVCSVTGCTLHNHLDTRGWRHSPIFNFGSLFTFHVSHFTSVECGVTAIWRAQSSIVQHPQSVTGGK